jgi:heme exporter protein A
MSIHNHQLCLLDLIFKRGQHVFFSKLSHTISSGEIIQIRGHNGSGKSTLLRILAGFIEPHEGRVTWNGVCISQNRDDYLENMSYIGHLNGIKPNLTVYENLSLICTLAGYKSKKLNIIIKKVGLEADMQARFLSAGQLRRLCLARLLITSSVIWLLDEPQTALDDEGQTLLNTLLIEHLANQGIAVIATHQALTLNYPIKTIFLGNHHAT